MLDDSQFKGGKWVDLIVPEGKEICKVETILLKLNGKLCGFKWIADKGEVLLAVGVIDNPNWRNEPEYIVTSLTLNYN